MKHLLTFWKPCVPNKVNFWLPFILAHTYICNFNLTSIKISVGKTVFMILKMLKCYNTHIAHCKEKTLVASIVQHCQTAWSMSRTCLPPADPWSCCARRGAGAAVPGAGVWHLHTNIDTVHWPRDTWHVTRDTGDTQQWHVTWPRIQRQPPHQSTSQPLALSAWGLVSKSVNWRTIF